MTVKPWSMKKLRPIFAPGMDVDGRQEAGDMVDQPRREIELAFPQPVADPMKAERDHARIEDNLPPGPGSRIPRLDGVQVCDKPRRALFSLFHHDPNLIATGGNFQPVSVSRPIAMLANGRALGKGAPNQGGGIDLSNRSSPTHPHC